MSPITTFNNTQYMNISTKTLYFIHYQQVSLSNYPNQLLQDARYSSSYYRRHNRLRMWQSTMNQEDMSRFDNSLHRLLIL